MDDIACTIFDNIEDAASLVVCYNVCRSWRAEYGRAAMRLCKDRFAEWSRRVNVPYAEFKEHNSHILPPMMRIAETAESTPMDGWRNVSSYWLQSVEPKFPLEFCEHLIDDVALFGLCFKRFNFDGIRDHMVFVHEGLPRFPQRIFPFYSHRNVALGVDITEPDVIIVLCYMEEQSFTSTFSMDGVRSFVHRWSATDDRVGDEGAMCEFADDYFPSVDAYHPDDAINDEAPMAD